MELPANNRVIDIKGRVYGRLTVESYAGKKGRKHQWECICECGSTSVVQGSNLRSGTTSSCGCYRKEKMAYIQTTHGHCSKSSPVINKLLYGVYHGIMDRCYVENNGNYEMYGAKGVFVCDEWKDNPGAFITWALANGYKKGLCIDKDIICDSLDITPKIYSPKTCKFITRSENSKYAMSKRWERG